MDPHPSPPPLRKSAATGEGTARSSSVSVVYGRGRLGEG